MASSLTLFFDTETNGKANFKAKPDHPSQPMLVQLAALLCDEKGQEVGCLNVLVKTNGWDIGPEVVAIHGITKEKADAEGEALTDVLLNFDVLAEKADIIVAHNINFDLLIMAVAYLKMNRSNPLIEKKKFCTMEATTKICKIRSPWGFKWPKLIEAYQHLFGESFEGAHDALADVRACARVYYAITQH